MNYEYNSSSIGGYQQTTVGSITVPSGKVWKITSGSAVNNTTGYSYMCGIFVDNNMVFGPGAGNGTPISNTPIWLSAGTYNVKFKNFEASDRYIKGALSIVEFNVE